LGAKPLASVAAFDIQKLYRELLDGDLSGTNNPLSHAVLRSALKQAVHWKLLLVNPADLVRSAEGKQDAASESLPSASQGTYDCHYWVIQYEALFRACHDNRMTQRIPRVNLGGRRSGAGVRSAFRDSRNVTRADAVCGYQTGAQSTLVKFQVWVIALLEKHKQRIEISGESDRAHDPVFSAKRGGPMSRIVFRFPGYF